MHSNNAPTDALVNTARQIAGALRPPLEPDNWQLRTRHRLHSLSFAPRFMRPMVPGTSQSFGSTSVLAQVYPR